MHATLTYTAMPCGRFFTKEGVRGYRFGFNGQMKDDEVYGDGNAYTALFWEYDPRLGRRWNIDPIMKETESPYCTFGNNPIFFVDPSGASPEGNGEGEKGTKNVVIFSKNTKDHNGAIPAMENNAKVGEDLFIIYADNDKDLKSEFERFYKENEGYGVGDVFVASHGSRNKAGFSIGTERIDNSNYSTSKSLDVLKDNLSSNSKVVIIACHAGSQKNGGVQMVGNLANFLGVPVFANQSWTTSGGVFTGKSTNSYASWKDPYSKDPYTQAAYDQAGYWTVGLPSNSPMLSHIRKDIMSSGNTYTTGSLIIYSNGTIGIDYDWGNKPNREQPTFTNNEAYGIIKSNNSMNLSTFTNTNCVGGTCR